MKSLKSIFSFWSLTNPNTNQDKESTSEFSVWTTISWLKKHSLRLPWVGNTSAMPRFEGVVVSLQKCFVHLFGWFVRLFVHRLWFWLFLVKTLTKEHQVHDVRSPSRWGTIPLWDKTRSFWDIKNSLSHERGSEQSEQASKRVSAAERARIARRAEQAKKCAEQAK